MNIPKQIMIKGTEEIIEEADSKKYSDFVDKFKPKLTTDDCYTPVPVYNAVAKWVSEEYKRDTAMFVRPFWPGCDYTTAEYPEGCTVVDNPPFSILSKILKFYQWKGVAFFLFAPSLTMYSSGLRSVCYISSDSDIVYANGAIVRTGFVTNLDKYQLRSAPSLHRAVKAANDAVQAAKKKELPKYSYPDHICTSAMVQKYSHYGIDFRVLPEDCTFVSALDAQKEKGKTIFGGGYLLSKRAAAERAAAERAAAERTAAERAAAERWTLSDREWHIVHAMGSGSGQISERWEDNQISMEELLT